MKTKLALFLLLMSCTGMAAAQTKAKAKSAAEHTTVAQQLDHMLSGVEGEFVSAADAMPEDKYNFAPTNGEFKGVRTFAQQVKHVAAVNYLIFSDMLGEKPPVEINHESGPDSMTSKADIMKYLRDSFALGHRAYLAVTPQNEVAPIKNPFGGKEPATRIGMATLIVGHCFDHYGQMVEYLRMNGIIPPASRPQPKK
ncbi:MAG: DinB family protein [Chlamydiota bacterium]